MKNSIKIRTDSYNVYISLIVKNTRLTKIFLVLGMLFLTTLMFFLFSKIEMELDSKLIIVLITLVLYSIPVKYFLWNFWGKENLIINTKSLSYSFDYGIIKPNIRTKNFDKLELYYDLGQIDYQQEGGHLLFYNYRNDNHLPELLYKTNVILLRIEIEEITKKINELYLREHNKNFEYVKFSEN